MSNDNQPADSRLREQLDNIFEEIGSSDSDWYEAHTLAKGDVWDYIECIHLTPKAVDKLEALCQEIAREAAYGFHEYIMGKDLIRPEADQAFNYARLHRAIDAYCEELTKQSAGGESDDYK